ncbi:MAG: type III pantothenate kinase, partial [Thermodesulfovibrionales bacterium]
MIPLLAIEIGNTTTGYVIYSDAASKDVYKRGHFSTKRILDNIDKEIIPHLSDIPHVVLSSVVPEATDKIYPPLKRHSKKLLVIDSQNIDTIVHVGNEKTGADRVSAMAGAYSLYKTDLAVVDFGTATTVSVVDRDARFVAGAILPGLELMLRCLHQNTAQLPEVKIKKIEKVTSIDTESSI